MHLHHIQRLVVPETVARTWPLPFLDMGDTPKITAVDSTVASTGIFLLFLPFSPQQGCQLASTGRPPRAPVACTWRRRHCDSVPHFHLVSPSGHSTSRMAGAEDWHRPSGRWTAAGWISWHWRIQSGCRRAPTTGGATT